MRLLIIVFVLHFLANRYMYGGGMGFGRLSFGFGGGTRTGTTQSWSPADETYGQTGTRQDGGTSWSSVGVDTLSEDRYARDLPREIGDERPWE